MKTLNLCPECNMPIRFIDRKITNASYVQPMHIVNGKVAFLKKRFAFDPRCDDYEEEYECPECGAYLCESEKTAIDLLNGVKVSDDTHGDVSKKFEQEERDE